MTGADKILESITQGDTAGLTKALAADPSAAGVRDSNGVSAVMTALYYGKADLADLLRRHLDDLDIFEASALGDSEAVSRLIKQSGVVNCRSTDGFTPLHLACFFNQPGIVQLLIQAGADINAVADNPSRVQPLHSAVACQSAVIVSQLLQAGAGVNAAQQGGWTALQAAAKHGNRELVELLLQHGADPGQAADDGQTALGMAADDSIQALLRNQAR